MMYTSERESSQTSPLRGVNLGNWLLVEAWMSPSLCRPMQAGDEYTLCRNLGDKAETVMREHRETWITEEDFAWLASVGINSVRIPFGYWILDADGPFVASPELLDHAVDCCERYGLAAILDLHGLPGSQGPEHHTGRAKHFQWPHEKQNVARSLDIIEQVAHRYAGRSCVAGFGVINEPHESIDRSVLVEFYDAATQRVRRHMPADDVAVVIAAYPENLMEQYHACLPAQPNIWTDVHLYQSFNGWPNEDPGSYLHAAIDRHQRIRKWADQGPYIVGEWSLSWEPRLHEVIRQLPPLAYNQFMTAYGSIQLATFEDTAGWYFWSYRVETKPEWSFRECVNRGWLPQRFDSKPSLSLDDAVAHVAEL